MKTIFETMVELQHKFNEQTIPNYLDEKLNWNNAIIAESGELLDSLVINGGKNKFLIWIM